MENLPMQNTKKPVEFNTLLYSIVSIYHILTSNKDVSILIQSVCDTLVKNEGIYNVRMILMENGQVVNSAFAGDGQSVENNSSEFSGDNMPLCVRQVVQHRKSIAFPYTLDVCSHCMTGGELPKSCYVIPMMLNNTITGVVIITLHPQRLERVNEIQLLDILANDIAAIFDKIRIDDEQSKVLAALIESEKKYRLLAETAQDLIFIIDLDKRIKYFNETFKKYAACKHLESGMPISEFIPDEKISSILRAAENLSRENDQTLIIREVMFTNDNDEVFPIEVCASPLYEQGTLKSVLFDARDISLHKRVLQEMQDLEKLLAQSKRLETVGTMAGGIAHDFNNILMPIIGFSDMALSSISKDDPLADYFTQILKSANRARDLVAQVLTFSRRVDQEVSPLSLQSFVTGILNDIKFSLPENIQIHKRLERSCPNILADADQIKQLVKNLCNNAIEAFDSNGGTIIVTLKHVNVTEELRKFHPQLVSSSYAELTISDDGPGMEEKVLERIFEPFYTTCELKKAKGLGLSVVHGIVMSHNGEIIAKSKVGEGAEFKVYLPIIQKNKPAEPEDRIVTGGKEMVLVVDDEEAVGNIIQYMLRRMGYKAKFFPNGKDALEEFKKYGDKYDLILTDLSMPGMTGLELTMEIRQTNKDIPIILITGFSENLDRNLQKDYEVQAVLGKPILARDLDKEIRNIMQKKNYKQKVLT